MLILVGELERLTIIKDENLVYVSQLRVSKRCFSTGFTYPVQPICDGSQLACLGIGYRDGGKKSKISSAHTLSLLLVVVTHPDPSVL